MAISKNEIASINAAQVYSKFFCLQIISVDMTLNIFMFAHATYMRARECPIATGSYVLPPVLVISKQCMYRLCESIRKSEMKRSVTRKDWLNTDEARKALGVSYCDLVHLREGGKLPFYKEGNAFRYARSGVQRVRKDSKKS